MEEKLVFLTIRQRIKAIPYGDRDHAEGGRNNGFKNLKGHTDLINTIPEADWGAIADALRLLNEPTTPFFTIGCEKAVNQYEGKFWVRGYLELAFNYHEKVTDAVNYFPLFFHFSRALAESGVRCSFEFELEGAHFSDGPVDGFSVTIWINSPLSADETSAKQEWSSGLDFLVTFFLAVPPFPELTPIYTTTT